MTEKEFYGRSLIFNLLEKKSVPQDRRVLVVKTGARFGLSFPAPLMMYKIGGPVWYIYNSDADDLELYSHDNTLIDTVQQGYTAIICFTGTKFVVMQRESSRSDYFIFATTPGSITIAQNQENFNLREYYNTENPSYDGTYPLIVTVTINPEIIIGGTNPSTAAFNTGTWPSGTVIHLYNSGEILGAGGGKENHLYFGGGVGGRGGDAVILQAPTVLYNTSGRIASGGGQGAKGYDLYASPDELISTSEASGAGGGQGYVGGWGSGNGSGNGSIAGPGLGQGAESLMNENYRIVTEFGYGGWWGCSGEQGCYAEANLMNKYSFVNDANADGETLTIYSGGPGRSFVGAEHLVVVSIGKITGPAMDLVNNKFDCYFCEPFACNLAVGKYLKKAGWNGQEKATVKIYVGSGAMLGQWSQYKVHDNHNPDPDHLLLVNGVKKVQQFSILFEADWPVGTTLKIENHGKIYGGGGCGRTETFTGVLDPRARWAYHSGADGGSCIATYFSLTIDNQGEIWAGGGGGGAKSREIIGWNEQDGYSTPLYKSNFFIPGSAGAGGGFAYGPYNVSRTHFNSIVPYVNNEQYQVNCGQCSTLTKGGRGGCGFAYPNLGGYKYTFHEPALDCQRDDLVVGSYAGVDYDYYGNYADYGNSYFYKDEKLPWLSGFGESPFDINPSWFHKVPFYWDTSGEENVVRSSGGSIGEPGTDGGLDWSTNPIVNSFDMGPNLPPGEPGYSVYGNSYVSWVNTGSKKGNLGG